MASVACIVEGDGEVSAVPILLRRIAQALDEPTAPSIASPMRIPATKLLRGGELERAVELAARRSGEGGAIFILLDCDDGCPAELGPRLLDRAMKARPDRTIALVLAKREFEAWFLASAESLRGRRGLDSDLSAPPNPESIRDAKGWLSNHMQAGSSYAETVDQPALTAAFDMDAARRAADSFDKCYREIVALLTAVRRVDL